MKTSDLEQAIERIYRKVEHEGEFHDIMFCGDNPLDFSSIKIESVLSIYEKSQQLYGLIRFYEKECKDEKYSEEKKFCEKISEAFKSQVRISNSFVESIIEKYPPKS